jgi:hypothetical protein
VGSGTAGDEDPGTEDHLLGPSPRGAGARSSRRRVVALAGGLLAIVLVVVAVVVATNDAPPPGKVAHDAGRNLRKAAGLALNGTYAGGHAMFTVTRAGTARGSYTAGGEQVDRIDVGATTYLKAGSRFWKAGGQSSANAARADGAWTKAPYNAVWLGMSSLTPDHLGQNLQEAGNDLRAEKATLNGVKVVKATAAGLTYFLSTGGQPRVLRVQGSVVNGAFSFDVTPLPSSAMSTFFSTLRKDVGGLKDAYNPNVGFLPTSGKGHFGHCGPSGCTVRGKIEPDAAGGSGAIHVVTTVEFRAPAGSVVSRCTDSTTATSKLQLGYSCRTSGARWTSWYRSHNGRFIVQARPTFKATVNSAKDVAHLLTLLETEQQTT